MNPPDHDAGGEGGRTLVVVPTYDEAETIREVLDRLVALPVDVDVLVVDDASPDGTGQIVAEVAATDPRVHVLHRASKDGLGAAYRAGFGWGLARSYDRLVSMDADLSHDPDALPTLLARIGDADLVIGSRYVPGGRIEQWSRLRRLLSAGGNRYVRLLTGLPVRDGTSGYRVARAALLRTIGVDRLVSDGYAFQLEVAWRAWQAGFALAEVPITFVERRAGVSKLSRSVVVEALLQAVRWALRGTRSPKAPHPASVRHHAD